MISLENEAGLRLTTARYYTPAGTSIQAKGITPDIVVRPMELKEVGDNITLREKDLDNHIESERKPDADSAGPQESEQSLNNEQGMQRDYQLLRALDLLKGWELLKGLKKSAA